MKVVLLLATGFAGAVALVVWRTQHSPEVWHTLADAPS